MIFLGGLGRDVYLDIFPTTFSFIYSLATILHQFNTEIQNEKPELVFLKKNHIRGWHKLSQDYFKCYETRLIDWLWMNDYTTNIKHKIWNSPRDAIANQNPIVIVKEIQKKIVLGV